MENQAEIMKALVGAGCIEFIDAAGKFALAAVENRRTGLSGLLSAEAGASLLEDYRRRMLLIYFPALMQELKEKIKGRDPAGLLIGKFSPEAIAAAAAELSAANGGDVRAFLHGKYPLLKKYSACTDKNFRESFSAFFDAFFARKEDIEQRLLGGQVIRELSGFTTGGADIHRHGRCVIGVRTNAGTFYYKPHDCGLDVFYHEVVSRWFSDCTAAPDVVSGDGYAFVSCLKHCPVQSETAVSDYFYHFGILAALFHGLGSTDMHHENIMAVGDRPSAVDIETILGHPSPETEDSAGEMQFGQQDHNRSLSRTCILPVRIYKGPLISPLYTVSAGTSSLPVFEGKRYTVEGFEEEFAEGFREGYRRVLDHREALIEMLKQRSGVAVRVLLNNTQFYALLRQQLFLPENLKDEASRQKVYGLLRSPYKGTMAGKDLEKSAYEWDCLLECDIPYFCTALHGKDLCGEDPSRVVRTHYFRESTADAAVRQLECLSEDEERFEIELIRNSFAHAPTDLSAASHAAPLASEAPSPEIIQKEIDEILTAVKRDVIHSTDGSLLWLSAVLNVRKMMYCGNLSLAAGIGAFCAAVLNSDMVPQHLKNEAGQLAEEICSLIRKELDRGRNEWPEEIREILPAGLYTGMGGILKACSLMERAGVKAAKGLPAMAAGLISSKKLYTVRDLSLAEGAAGLIIAMADLAPRSDAAGECIRLCADRLIGEDLPDRADSAYGCAGTGTALISAYGALREDRYYLKALRAFQKVGQAYDPKLCGWPDANAKLKFLAGKGPHAAGIFLSADLAKGMLSRAGCDSGDELNSILDRIAKTALESLLAESSLTHSDTLDQGNALTVTALSRAGEAEAAGRVLAAMLQRKERTGSFTVMPPGIRSTFDPAFYVGTLGIGYAMVSYLNVLQSAALRKK